MMLVVSGYGESAPLVRRMHRDGYDAVLYTIDPFRRSTGYFKGLCPMVDTWADAMRAIQEPGSTVIFDGTGRGDIAHQLSLTAPVWGDSPLADKLEEDRGEAMRILATCGVRIPRTILFHPDRESGGDERFQTVKGHIREAIQMAATLKGSWMVKPYSGTSSQTFKADTIDELIDHLKDMPNHSGGTDPFILQQCIKGVELSTEVWIGRGEIIPCTCNATIETKRFYPGDLGPNTGSETSLVWPYGIVDPKILRETIGCGAFRQWLRNPVLDGLRYPPYSGPLDINCLVSDEDHHPYAIEFTPRMGWSAYIALAETLEDGELWNVLNAAATGRLSGLPWRANYGYCVKLSVPPYPVSDDYESNQRLGTFYRELMNQCRGVEIGGPVDSPHVWLRDAVRKNGKYEIAGVDGSVADIGGSGRTIEEARDSAHGLFDQILVPNKQGRTIDGADRAIRDTGKLSTWGYEVPHD